MVIAHATSANHQKKPIRVRIDALNADRFLPYVFSYRYYLWHSIMSNQMSIIHVSDKKLSCKWALTLISSTTYEVG